MITELETTERLAGEIDATEEKILSLNQALKAVREPASFALQPRLEAIDIEEHALQRNFAEIRQNHAGDEEKIQKVETLLHHIEAEEAALEHEAEFLSQGAPSTLEFAFRIGSCLYDLIASGVKKVMGDHHLLWQSPFVNTTIASLAVRFNLPDKDVDVKRDKRH